MSWGPQPTLSAFSAPNPISFGCHQPFGAFSLPSPAMEAPPLTQAVAEYIWLQGTEVRSRTKVLEGGIPQSVEALPVIVVDGRVSNQSAEDLFEVVLRPRKIFKDPFRGGASILVLCDAFEPTATSNEARVSSNPTLQPLATNTRVPCESVMKRAAQAQPVLAAEQEYVVNHPTTVPVAPSHSGGSRSTNSSNSRSGRAASSCCNQPQRSHHSSGGSRRKRQETVPLPHEVAGISPPPSAGGLCSSGPLSAFAMVQHSRGCMPAAPSMPVLANSAASRQLSEAHLRCCLYAGIKTSGGGATSTPGAWSYKVGPCSGLDFGDDLWMSRFLLSRCAEQVGLQISYDPEQSPNGHLGCYVKYSTADTRDTLKGLLSIEDQLARLQAKHLHHAWAYNQGHTDRLIEDKNLSNFVYAVANCSASVMIPGMTMMRRCGYYVDRRPPADCDPYTVAMLLAATTLEISLPLYIPQPPAALPKAMPIIGQTGRQASVGSAWGSGSQSGLSSAMCGSEAADDEDDDDSMNTDDLLLDELERMDAPEEEEGEEEDDECCSEATSGDSSAQVCSDGSSPADLGLTLGLALAKQQQQQVQLPQCFASVMAH